MCEHTDVHILNVCFVQGPVMAESLKLNMAILMYGCFLWTTLLKGLRLFETDEMFVVSGKYIIAGQIWYAIRYSCFNLKKKKNAEVT